MEWRERQTASGRGFQGPAGFVLSISPFTEGHTVLKRALYLEDSQVHVAPPSREAVRRLTPLVRPPERRAVGSVLRCLSAGS